MKLTPGSDGANSVGRESQSTSLPVEEVKSTVSRCPSWAILGVRSSDNSTRLAAKPSGRQMRNRYGSPAGGH
jgi:hypothetical protein